MRGKGGRERGSEAFVKIQEKWGIGSGGGGRRVEGGGGGQGGCKRRSEVFVKIKKKSFFFFFFFFWGGSGGGWSGGGGPIRGWGRGGDSKVLGRWVMCGMGYVNLE